MTLHDNKDLDWVSMANTRQSGCRVSVALEVNGITVFRRPNLSCKKGTHPSFERHSKLKSL